GELMFEATPRPLLSALAGFTRLIVFDKRGTGLSDRDVGYPTLEARMDDMRAVLDAASSEKAAIFGVSEGGSMSILFAAAHHDRTHSLMTFGAFACRVRSEDYPWAPTPEERNAWIDSIEGSFSGEMDIAAIAPSIAHDEEAKSALARYFRMSASPSMAAELGRLNTLIDVRSILPAVRVPTLVMHREGDRDSRVEEGEFIAARIPDAKFVRLPGEDHLPFVGDWERVAETIRTFLKGAEPPRFLERVLTTILFTDIVGSTSAAAKLGDARWRQLLGEHDRISGEQVRRFNGRLVKLTGDGLLATFDGPARALLCANALQKELSSIGIQLRAGVHTGEVELRGDDIGGIAVHIAARIMSEAGAGEIYASRVLRDICVGSGIEFEPLGTAQLKGIDEPVLLLRAEVVGTGP
ncbi:MAG TPA: adenylate/guanylate cyclase domain-containing protein, partial [Fimbriimonadaceae bacterium]|nr:adenylate/guanylate cyclase domain-containing protein [Fimbriimonadaceae bacterium]